MFCLLIRALILLLVDMVVHFRAKRTKTNELFNEWKDILKPCILTNIQLCEFVSFSNSPRALRQGEAWHGCKCNVLLLKAKRHIHNYLRQKGNLAILGEEGQFALPLIRINHCNFRGSYMYQKALKLNFRKF